MENGTYVIYNDYVDTKTGLSLPLPEGVEAMVNTGSEIPLYQIIKPNIVNNVDSVSYTHLSGLNTKHGITSEGVIDVG